MLADRGYDAEWFRNVLAQKGVTPCIPDRKSHSTPVKYDKRRYKRRNRIDIMFGRLKNGVVWQHAKTAKLSPSSSPRSDRHPTLVVVISES